MSYNVNNYIDQRFTIFGQERWLRAQQQWLCILDHVVAVAAVSGLSRQAAKGLYAKVYKTRIAALLLVRNTATVV